MKKSIFGLIAVLIFSTQVLAAPSIKIYENFVNVRLTADAFGWDQEGTLNHKAM